MKIVITLITTAALAGSLVTAAFAQAAGPKNGGQGQGLGQGQRQGQGQQLQNRARAGQMQKINQEVLAKLNLNKRQQSKLEAAQKKLQDGLKELMEKARETKDRAAFREEAQKLQTEYRETVKTTLTEQQLKKYQELMRAALEKLRKDGGGATDRKTDRAGKGGKAGRAGGGGGGG
ncbi:MAG: hypothetical protein M9921_09795 [Fimbriimonadaceae bacterium]|nr:hypothetical protein [Chthonomonadaceae bacterium]MCO5297136.1 hypothetical protein [Fimbriimonadaceae bacterium]